MSGAGGLFITRGHSGGRAFAAHRARRSDANDGRIDAFAEALAELGTVTAAAKAIGVSQQRGSALLKRIKDGLGRQAYG